jgi:hypothetical protein
MAANDLSETDASKLIYSYKDADVTDQLYTFGSSLLSDLKERSEHVNTKATTVLVWATGILAFLFAQSDKFAGTASQYFSLCSALLALLAASSAFFSLRTRDDWKWPSDKSWLQSKAVNNSDELKRYHLRVMHGVKQARHGIIEKKGNRLMYAELFLVLSGVLLFVGLLAHFIAV